METPTWSLLGALWLHTSIPGKQGLSTLLDPAFPVCWNQNRTQGWHCWVAGVCPKANEHPAEIRWGDYLTLSQHLKQLFFRWTHCWLMNKESWRLLTHLCPMSVVFVLHRIRIQEAKLQIKSYCFGKDSLSLDFVISFSSPTQRNKRKNREQNFSSQNYQIFNKGISKSVCCLTYSVRFF